MYSMGSSGMLKSIWYIRAVWITLSTFSLPIGIVIIKINCLIIINKLSFQQTWLKASWKFSSRSVMTWQGPDDLKNKHNTSFHFQLFNLTRIYSDKWPALVATTCTFSRRSLSKNDWLYTTVYRTFSAVKEFAEGCKSVKFVV